MEGNLKQIIMRREETKEIEYKGPMAWGTDKKENCELVKDILALANTKGGWIVFGLRELPTGYELAGLTQQQADSFDTTKINNFVNNYADPPINSSLVKRTFDGKTFIFISVPRFTDTPHICQKDFPKVLSGCTLYVRTDNNESAPLKSSSDFRALIETSVRNRSDQLLESIHHILKHGTARGKSSDSEVYKQQEIKTREIVDGHTPEWAKAFGFREVVFYPVRSEAFKFELRELRKMAEAASISYTGWPLLFIARSRKDVTYNVDDGIESILIENTPDYQYWKLYQSGLLFAKEILTEETEFVGSGVPPILDFVWLCQYAGMAVDCLVKLYDSHIGDEENIFLRFKLTNMKDKFLGSLDPRRHISPIHQCKVAEISYENQRTLAEWKSGINDYAIEICNYVFQRFNWEKPNLGEARNIIEKMFSRIIG